LRLHDEAIENERIMNSKTKMRTIEILTILLDKLLCLPQEIGPLLLPLPVSPSSIIFSAPQAELSLMRSICIFPIQSFNDLLDLSQLILLPEQYPRMQEAESAVNHETLVAVEEGSKLRVTFWGLMDYDESGDEKGDFGRKAGRAKWARAKWARTHAS
jgi:hypothetical protein